MIYRGIVKNRTTVVLTYDNPDKTRVDATVNQYTKIHNLLFKEQLTSTVTTALTPSSQNILNLYRLDTSIEVKLNIYKTRNGGFAVVSDIDIAYENREKTAVEITSKHQAFSPSFILIIIPTQLDIDSQLETLLSSISILNSLSLDKTVFVEYLTQLCKLSDAKAELASRIFV